MLAVRSETALALLDEVDARAGACRLIEGPESVIRCVEMVYCQ